MSIWADVTPQSHWLRDEALLMLEGRGAVLETARHVSRILLEHNIAGGVIRGVSVALHGHVRATTDVDVFVPDPLTAFADRLLANGYEFYPLKREFLRHQVPVRLIAPAQAIPAPSHFEVIDDVRTVSLADLINLKLHSGSSSILRSKDLADVIALIRANRLDGRFANRIGKSHRAEFRSLVSALRSAEKNRPADSDDPYSHSG